MTIKYFFRETIFRPFKGAAPSNIYTRYRLTQAYQCTPSRGTGVPLKNFNRENLKFGLKFSVLPSITSGLLVVSSQNFFSNRNGDPPKNLKFSLKFSVLPSITSGLLGVSSQNFFQSTCRKAGLKTGYNFWRARPQKFARAKNRPKFFATSDNFRL